jgi:hypothetical protein
MTAALLLDRPGSPLDSDSATAGRPPVPLEARLTGVLHATRTNGSGECPVCHGRMTSTRASARAEAVCGGCGSRLG